MPTGAALLSGMVGACTLTLVHEAARHSIPHAPRVNAIGERIVRRSARALGLRVPGKKERYLASLAGELVSNSLYYSVAAVGGSRRSVPIGALLGAVGGLGAFTLPEPLGLGRQPGRKSPNTELMTLAWYTLGGVAAGTAYRYLAGRTPVPGPTPPPG